MSLLRTAERLFHEKGLEAVSLREIAAEAQQKNHSAAGYHFGSKEGVVDAILTRHAAAIARAYDEGMDALDARGDAATLEEVLSLVVRPVAEKLQDEDGGRAYLSLCAQLSVSERLPLESREAASSPSAQRVWAAIQARARIPDELVPLRQARFAAVLYASLLQYDRLQRLGTVRIPLERFVDELVSTLACVLTAGRRPEGESASPA